MINVIEQLFKTKQALQDPHQLQASGHLSVSAAKFGSSASFKRQVMVNANKITLEDLFSLMHQNILASTNYFNQTADQLGELPEELQPLLRELSAYHPKIDLLSITYKYPAVSLEYNIPLSNHSAKLILDYDTKTKKLTLHGKYFGINHAKRMDYLAAIAGLEGKLLGGTVNKEPKFDNNSRLLDFDWVLEGDDIQRLGDHITGILDHYEKLTKNWLFLNIPYEFMKLFLNYSAEDDVSLSQHLSPEGIASLRKDLSYLYTFDQTIIHAFETVFPKTLARIGHLDPVDRSTVDWDKSGMVSTAKSLFDKFKHSKAMQWVHDKMTQGENNPCTVFFDNKQCETEKPMVNPLSVASQGIFKPQAKMYYLEERDGNNVDNKENHQDQAQSTKPFR